MVPKKVMGLGTQLLPDCAAQQIFLGTKDAILGAFSAEAMESLWGAQWGVDFTPENAEQS